MNEIEACTVDFDVKEIEDFLKQNVPAEVTFSVPKNSVIQLMNALEFAKTVPHGRFAFLAKGGGYCLRGYILGGNGIQMKAGTSYGYPFSGNAKDIYGNDVDLSIFQGADTALAEVLSGVTGANPGDVMEMNDRASWMNRGFALAILGEAIEGFNDTPPSAA